MDVSQDDWYASYLIPDLKAKTDECITAGKDSLYFDNSVSNLKKLNIHINELSEISGIKPGKWISNLNYKDFNANTGREVKVLLDSMRNSFRTKSREISYKRDTLFRKISGEMGEDKFLELRSKHYNEGLADVVLNRISKNKIYDSEDRLIQKADPVFMIPGSNYGRAHFFAPFKQVGNLKIATLIFNVIVIWLMILTLFVALYYNLLKRFIAFLESLKLPIMRKFGRELLQF
jgi:ABC transport system ATP-binding/permease protein